MASDPKETPKTERREAPAGGVAAGSVGGNEILINRPKPGSIEVVNTSGVDKLKFNFASHDAKLIVLDVDVVIAFPDGSKIILPGLALDVVRDGDSEINFQDVDIPAEKLIAMVGDVKLSEIDSKAIMASSASPSEGERQAKGKEEEAPAPAAQPIAAVSVRDDHTADFNKKADDDNPAPLNTKTGEDSASSSSSSSSASSSHTADATPNDNTGLGNVLAANLTVILYGSTGLTSSTDSSTGVTTIKGSPFVDAAATDSLYATQHTDQTITGTAGNDIIWADNPTASPAGTSVRVLDVAAELPTTDAVAYVAKITGLPDGYVIENSNAQLSGSTWYVPLSYTDANHVQLILRYVVPTDGTTTDASGYYQTFTLTVTYLYTTSSGSGTAAGNVTVAIGDTTDSTDTYVVSADGSSTTYVLDATPNGHSINAGAGDDTVHAGAGVDTIDGGTGHNTIAYDLSSSGVTIDLSSTSAQSGGYAKGDLISNFDGVIGSTHNDSLTANNNGDTIDGNGGSDTIIGGTGDDLISYHASEAIVSGDAGTNTLVLKSTGTINLGTVADQTSGDSAVVTGFTHVDASALTAGASISGSSGANSLTGGSGADTIDGAGGADTINAGTGNDSVTERGTEATIEGGTGTDTLVLAAGTGTTSANLSLTDVDQTTGDSVVAQNFESLDASAIATALRVTGSSSANTMIGGSGDDTIDGAGGADAISAGAGNDTVTERSAETSIDGGAGTDTLILTSASTVTSVNFAVTAGSDQTSGDTPVVSNFESLDASAMTSALTATGSLGANTITTGSGNDTVDGGSGADAIATGLGNDRVSFYGTESSVDGGGGTNTLVLKAAATLNLANTADQTSGDSSTVTNFTHVDASLLMAGANITGSTGANSITGGSGNDTLDGNGGADSISSGAGNDTITEHGAETTIDGGAGTDTLVLTASSGVTSVDFTVAATADQTVGDTVTVLKFENVDGSALSSALNVLGSSSANSIIVGSGLNTVDGGGGADTIVGGSSTDYIYEYGSETSIDGGGGSNRLILKAGSGVTSVNFTNTTDETFGDSAIVKNFQSLDASAMTTGVSVVGGSSGNSFFGGSGNDTIDGGGGGDTISAGSGNDTVIERGSEASIDGGAGTDTLTLAATAGASAVNIASGTDQTTGDSVTVIGFENVDASALNAGLSISGSTGANSIIGSTGNDTISGGGGADSIYAGAGNDRVDYNAIESVIDGGIGTNTLVMQLAGTVNLGNTLDQTSGDNTTVTNFQNIDGSAVGSVQTLTGSTGANNIIGGTGADTIDGAGGADSINAGTGNDTVTERGTETSVDGGTGNDTLVLVAGTATTTVDFSVASNADQTIGDSVSVIHFESLDASSVTNALNVTGSTGVNTIVSGSGDDTINSNGGADSIDAGAGNDTVLYHGTEAAIAGGIGTNTLVLDTAATVNLSQMDQTLNDVAVVTGFQNVDASALSGANLITGSSGANSLVGGSGNDTLDGNGGVDTVSGGDGDDSLAYRGTEAVIDGGNGTNTLVFKVAATVNLANGADQTSGDSAVVTNIQNVDASALSTGVSITGSSAVNMITGGSGSDTIDGNDGADSINAGAGADRVTERGAETTIDGGSGSDTLVLTATSGVTTVNFSVSSGSDQTTGDSVEVYNFESVNASTLGSSLVVTGSLGANTIVGSALADTIDGSGGADSITAGGGNDIVSYYGTETLVDGGGGTNTLLLKAGATIDLSLSDQTSGDTTNVANFQNIDAGALTTGSSLTGSTTANTIIGSLGNDTIDGGGGADSIGAGQGDDQVTERGGETTIDGGAGSDTLILTASAGVTAVNLGAAANTDQTSGDSTAIYNFENVNASALSTGITISASSLANSVIGSSGADTIDAVGGNDSIAAGGGNDRVSYYGSEQSIDGGTGTNTLVLKTVATVDLSVTADQTTGDSVTVSNFQNVDASALGVGTSITGSTGANSILGSGAADTIDGGGGSDIINAGTGNDTVTERGAETAIDGGSGTDALVLVAGTAVTAVDFTVASGSDETTGDTVSVINFESLNASAVTSALMVTGDNNAQSIITGTGNDAIDGGGGSDTISTGAGNDRIVEYGSEISINGGSGTDTLVLSALSGVTSVNLSVTSGTDQTSGDGVTVANMEYVDASALTSALALTGETGANSLTGGSGDDTIDGGGGVDTINAGAGNDLVTSRGAESVVDGGTGIDMLVLLTGTAVTAVNFAVAAGSDQTTGDTAAIRNFEGLDASTVTSALSVTGASGASSIATGSGTDTIDGGGGADTISAGAGNDRVSYYGTENSIDGGADTNMLILRATTTVNLSNGDQTTGDVTSVTNFQNVDASAIGTALSMTGSTSANSIIGGSGADTIDGGGGADTLNAGGGNDTVVFQGSEASVNGGTGSNTLVLTLGSGVTSVNLASTTDETTGDTTTVVNFSNLDASAYTTTIAVTGSTGANSIIGGSGADTIDGSGGTDTIIAGGGSDRVMLYGTEASIDGGNGNDTLVLVNAITIDLSSLSDQTSGDNATVTGFEHIDASNLTAAVNLIGSSSGNSITGGAGNDTINGYGGSDTIDAGAGNDLVTVHGTESSVDGGAGTDTLVVASGSGITSVNLSSLTDQTTGDSGIIVHFENTDASAVNSSLTILGSTSANAITGGAGNNTIDGGGGADTIVSGSNDDMITEHGAEASISAGSGFDTLILLTSTGVTSVNLSSLTDQTTGDTAVVTGFEALDASSISTALSITGGSGANLITGGSGADTINGGGGADTINGGGGNDQIAYRGSEASIDGGTGTDTLKLYTMTSVDLSVTADQTTNDLVTVTGFENVDASPLSTGTWLAGSNAANSITGGSGIDTIDGNGGADTIDAGAGDDLITERGSEATINGGAGNDLLTIASGVTLTSVNLSVAAGSDETVGDSVAVINIEGVDASALSTALTMIGSSGTNTLIGGSGEDTIDGGGGADSINAGAGNDTAAYYGTETLLDGGAGVNTLVMKSAATVYMSNVDQTSGDVGIVSHFQNIDATAVTTAMSITGSSGADSILAGTGADTIYSNGGADTINAGGGNDVIYYLGTEAILNGGVGTNTLVLSAAVTVNLSNSADQTTGDSTAVTNIQSVDGSQLSAALSLAGSTGADTLLGGSGADTIDGGGGADSVSAGAGNDEVSYYGSQLAIDGGNGTDTLILKTAVTVALSNADQTTGDSTTVSNFENVDGSGLSVALNITGNSGANSIVGGSGNDWINGNFGSDTISGGAGNDTISWSGNEATVDGGTGTDTLRAIGYNASWTVNLANTSDQTTGDSATVVNFENYDGGSMTAAQKIYGSSVANSLTGGSGNDTVDGNGGADTISTGSGDDTVYERGSEAIINAGTGNYDRLVLMAGSGVTSVNLGSTTDQTTGDSATVTNFKQVDASAYTSGIIINGSSVYNYLLGSSGDDTINGGGGNDSINGGGGNDTITEVGSENSIDGGAGTDTLVLGASSSVTTVTLSNSGDQTVGDSVNVVNFEYLDASAMTTGLSITGTTSANSIIGGTSSDSISGGGGADTIDGGGSNDTIDGGGGAASITGGAGNDILFERGTEAAIDGGAGADTLLLVGSTGVTTVDLSSTTDQTNGDSTSVINFENVAGYINGLGSTSSAFRVIGSSAANNITGGTGNDTIDGGGGSDTINGWYGNDVITERGSESAIDGSADTDTLILVAGSGVTAVDLSLGGNNDQTSGDTVAIYNFEYLDASAYTTALTVSGSSAANSIITGSGNDTINGNGGSDTINAGAGNDTVTDNGSEATIDGGAGTDLLILSAVSGVSTVNLASTTDQTTGDSGTEINFESINASALGTTLVITGSTGANTIIGGTGNDTIDGNGGADSISAGNGNDIVTVRGSETAVDGGAGTDTIVINSGSVTGINLASTTDQTSGDSATVTNFENVDASALSAGLTITGSTGTNSLIGGSGNDTIDGGGGTDTINANGGNNTVYYYGTEANINGGVSGTNTLYMSAAATVNLSTNADQTVGDAAIVSNFTHVNASSLSSVVVVTGSSAANSITGGSGADTIDGNGGADTINAGSGNDTVTENGAETTIDGGSGSDLLTLASGSGVTSIDMSVASGSDQTGGDSVSVYNFESADASALTANLSITGSSGANAITSGSGNDTIDGHGSADNIHSGSGADTVTIHGGESVVDGGSGNDTLVIASDASISGVDLSSGSDQTSGDSVTVTNFESLNASAYGSALTITGTSSADSIVAGSGNDTIDGGDGADTIRAGGGNDTITEHGNESMIDGGAGSDKLILSSGSGITGADLSSNSDQTSDDNTTVTNVESVDASALSVNLTLTGSSAANLIIGGSGNDTINGGGGKDTLSGGGGDDHFTIDISSLSLGSTIDGGSGSNSVTISGASGTVTDSELAASLTNVQSIDFTASGIDVSLNLSGSQIAQIAGGASNTLTLNINSGDNVSITDQYYDDNPVNASTHEYTIYADSNHNTVIAHLTTVAA